MIAVDLLIFDLDGTLIDSKQDIADAVNGTRGHFGLEAIPLSQVVDSIGSGVQNLILRTLGPEHADLKEKALKIFREIYGKCLLEHTVMQPGALEILHHFRSKSKAVLTNKPGIFTLKILEGLGIADIFGAVECGDGPGGRKPDPGGIRRILAHFSAEPRRTVIIGDSPLDIETGRAAAIHTCAILDGYSSREVIEKSRPDVIINAIRELKEHYI